MRKHIIKQRFSAVWQTVTLIILLLIGIGCSQSSLTKTEEALEYADALLQAVEAFESARGKTAAHINESTTDVTTMTRKMESNASLPENIDKKPISTTIPITIELPDIAKTWEERWIIVHSQYDTLETTFSEVGTRSITYFEHLETITAEITDDDLRTAEESKNHVLKSNWTTAYEQASADIAELRGLIVKGDDFERILRLAAMRASLEEDILQLQAISEQAQVLLIDLEQLTVEGRRLTSGIMQSIPTSNS